MLKSEAKFGFNAQKESSKDYIYSYETKQLPAKIDISNYFSLKEPFNQSNLSSCTANAASAALIMIQTRNKQNVIIPARLLIYYLTRQRENTIEVDSGANLRDVFDVINNFGFIDEKEYPYEIEKFKEAPSLDTLRLAQLNNIQYHLIKDKNLQAVKHCLASGKPIVFGFWVYDNFFAEEFKRNDWTLSYPSAYDSFNGGHAVVAVGYDDEKQRIKVLNSWGKDWGKNGYFYMDYKMFFSNKTIDLWTVDFKE